MYDMSYLPTNSFDDVDSSFVDGMQISGHGYAAEEDGRMTAVDYVSDYGDGIRGSVMAYPAYTEYVGNPWDPDGVFTHHGCGLSSVFEPDVFPAIYLPSHVSIASGPLILGIESENIPSLSGTASDQDHSPPTPSHIQPITSGHAMGSFSNDQQSRAPFFLDGPRSPQEIVWASDSWDDSRSTEVAGPPEEAHGWYGMEHDNVKQGLVGWKVDDPESQELPETGTMNYVELQDFVTDFLTGV
jgi:hypothetical protein